MATTIPNFNRIKFDTYPSILKPMIDQLDESDSKLKEHLLRDLEEFENACHELTILPGGTELIALEESLWDVLEQFLEPLDIILNFRIEDIWYSFDEADLTTEEALATIPTLTAAQKIFPKDPHDEHSDYINPAQGDTYGFFWPEEELQLLLESIESPKTAEPVAVLQLTDLWLSVRHAHQKLKQWVDQKQLSAPLSLLRQRRKSLGLGIPILLFSIYPDLKWYREPWILDPRTVTYPILDQQHILKTMMEFSYNDLSHESFLTIATPLVKTFLDSDDYSALRVTSMIIHFEEFKNALEPFRTSSRWDEFSQSEANWYRDVERIFLRIKNSFESNYYDDPVKWKEHEEGSQYQAAMKLWEELPHSPFDSWLTLSRGYVINNSQWETMRDSFSEPNFQILLQEIGAKEIYRDCIESDKESREIALTVHEEGVNGLKQLRDLRERMVAELNVIPMKSVHRNTET